MANKSRLFSIYYCRDAFVCSNDAIFSMKNSFSFLLFSLFILTSLTGCDFNRKIPEDFDYGKVVNGQYRNKYFNMIIPFDTSWSVKTREEMEMLSSEGDSMLNEDFISKEELESARVNSANLFYISKYDDDAKTIDNPSLFVSVENLSIASNIIDEDDYLDNLKEVLSNTQVDYTFSNGSYEREIGSKRFHVMEAYLDVMGYTLTQEFMICNIGGFIVLITLTHTTKASGQELSCIVDKIRI